MRYLRWLLVVIALGITGCGRPHSEMYAWGDDWVVLDYKQAETFFADFKQQLASEGFSLRTSPADPLVAGSGVQPNAGDQLYWYHGSFQGSHEFSIKLLRSGPHQESFHLMYFWDIATTSPTNEDMEAITRRLHESLKDWVKKNGLAWMPPNTP